MNASDILYRAIEDSIPNENPPYVEFKHDSWELKRIPVPAGLGYFTWGPVVIKEPLWVLQKNDVVWMSDSPRELQSMWYAIYRAHGTVVIGGLGMGWVAWKIAQLPHVDKVIVIEYDRELIDIFDKMVGGAELPFQIFERDIFETNINDLGVEKVDFMFLDIWETIGTDKAVIDAKIIHNRIPSEELAYWGQEHDIGFFGLKDNPENLLPENKMNYMTLFSAGMGMVSPDTLAEYNKVLKYVNILCPEKYATKVSLPLSHEIGYEELCAIVLTNSLIEKDVNNTLFAARFKDE